MKDTKHKILTLAALTTIAAGVIHLTNRVIVASSQLKEMLVLFLRQKRKRLILYKLFICYRILRITATFPAFSEWYNTYCSPWP